MSHSRDELVARAEHAALSRLIEHGTVNGRHQCKLVNRYPCQLCRDAWAEYQHARRIAAGQITTILVPVNVLAVALATDSASRVALRGVLGDRVCDAIQACAAARHCTPPLDGAEYERLRDLGVSEHAAAVLAAGRARAARNPDAAAVLAEQLQDLATTSREAGRCQV
jgi:hypothetical protein